MNSPKAVALINRGTPWLNPLLQISLDAESQNYLSYSGQAQLLVNDLLPDILLTDVFRGIFPFYFANEADSTLSLRVGTGDSGWHETFSGPPHIRDAR
jgi:hypothetical protein